MAGAMSHQGLPMMIDDNALPQQLLPETAVEDMSPRSSPALWPRMAKIALVTVLGVVALLGGAAIFSLHQQNSVSEGLSLVDFFSGQWGLCHGHCDMTNEGCPGRTCSTCDGGVDFCVTAGSGGKSVTDCHCR